MHILSYISRHFQQETNRFSVCGGGTFCDFGHFEGCQEPVKRAYLLLPLS